MIASRKLNHFDTVTVNIFKTPVLHIIFSGHILLSVFFITIIDIPRTWGSSLSCSQFYESQPRTLVDHIVKNLQENPNGFPALIISESLQEYLQPIIEKYQKVMERATESNAINPIKTMVSSTETALTRFYELSSKINKELDRSTKNRRKILELSEDLRSCFSNLMLCRTNIKDQLPVVRSEIERDQAILDNIKSIVDELNRFKAELPSLTDIPQMFHNELKNAIDSQTYLLEHSLRLVLQSHIEVQTQLLNLAQAQIPLLVRVQSDAANLESAGAKDIGALELLSGRKSNKTVVPEQTLTDFSKRLESSQRTQWGGDFIRMASDGYSIRQLFDTLNTDRNYKGVYLSLKDVQEIAEIYLKKIHKDSSTGGFVNYDFKLKSYSRKSSWTVLNEGFSGLKYLIFLTGSSHPQIYIEYNIWLNKLIDQKIESIDEQLAALDNEPFRLNNVLKKFKIKSTLKHVLSLFLKIKNIGDQNVVRTAQSYPFDTISWVNDQRYEQTMDMHPEMPK
ncbi:MAG: hypothetical protein JNL11_09595 [Bdellovibrionaceae bacterium]|nr:hypothetical protein [Pseudobdellovibrionaceae bacterium]